MNICEKSPLYQSATWSSPMLEGGTMSRPAVLHASMSSGSFRTGSTGDCPETLYWRH